MTEGHNVAEPVAAEAAARILRSPRTIRERCGQLLERARQGESRWFTVQDDAIAGVARDVADLTKKRFHKHIPLHSRWRHFEAGGVDRKAELARLLGDRARVWPTSRRSASTSTSRCTAAGATSRPAASTARPNSIASWATAPA
jgi:hypothetical protein